MNRAIELNVTSSDTIALRQGLAVAKSLVRRRFLDAFDKGGTEVLNLLMSDISEASKELTSQQEDDFMEFCYSELRNAQHKEELLAIS